MQFVKCSVFLVMTSSLRFSHILKHLRHAALRKFRNNVYRACFLVESDNPTFYKVSEERNLTSSSSITNKISFSLKNGSVAINTGPSNRQLLPNFLSKILVKAVMEIKPPEAVRGMKTLDRSAFDETVVVPALKVPVRNVGNVVKELRKSALRITKVKPIVEMDKSDPDHGTHKWILLNGSKHPEFDSFGDEMKESLGKLGITRNSFDNFKLKLTYENWTIAEVLKAVLTSDAESVAGFSTIGHIAHLNLKDAHLEFKSLIGEVILDKLKILRTVVNKTKTIDNTYRNFQMELIAGENDMFASVKENGCVYEFDFSKVYWNPRLGTEHQRIVDQLTPRDVVYDVFAGVGPFVVPAARKLCEVYANDLNPESFKWLKHNVEKKNKIKVPVHFYNLDGREFIQTIGKNSIVKQFESEDFDSNSRFCFVMNLPALAIEFLDGFIGLFAGNADLARKVHILIYCYGFSKAVDTEGDIKTRIESVLLCQLPDSDTSMRFVRNVAPSKDMMCCSFRMPVEVLLGTNQSESENNSEVQPARKKPKISNS